MKYYIYQIIIYIIKNHNLTFQCDITAIKSKAVKYLQARPNKITLVCKDNQTNPVFEEV